MKLFKFLIIINFLITSPIKAKAGELYEKFGKFDHNHDTDSFLLTTKYVGDKDIDLKYLQNTKQIFEISLYYDDDSGAYNTGSNGTKDGKREGYGAYISSGIQKQFSFLEKIFFVPSFSVGLYQEFDEGKDMGFPVEFKSEVELNYKLFQNSIIGFSFSHISNADIGDKNPGSDNIALNFRIKENF